MKIEANSVEEYIKNLPEDRKPAIVRLRETINKNIPSGFEETISYGMIGWVVPLSTYPSGYHCTADTPLPFASLASQKNYIAVYHMGIYANPKLLKWFQEEYKKQVPTKLDMGKSCIRFKNIKNIPYDLVGELFQKINVEDWIAEYEKNIKKK